MTREEFIEILDKKGYSYKIEGDKIIVTHESDVSFDDLTSLPPDIEFKNVGDVYVGLRIRRLLNEWKFNIKGIDNKRLLNFMISKGVFER